MRSYGDGAGNLPRGTPSFAAVRTRLVVNTEQPILSIRMNPQQAAQHPLGGSNEPLLGASAPLGGANETEGGATVTATRPMHCSLAF